MTCKKGLQVAGCFPGTQMTAYTPHTFCKTHRMEGTEIKTTKEKQRSAILKMGVTFYWTILLSRGKPGKGMSSSWFCSVTFPRPSAVLTLISALHVTLRRKLAWDAFSAFPQLWPSQLEWIDKLKQGRIRSYFFVVSQSIAKVAQCWCMSNRQC